MVNTRKKYNKKTKKRGKPARSCNCSNCSSCSNSCSNRCNKNNMNNACNCNCSNCRNNRNNGMSNGCNWNNGNNGNNGNNRSAKMTEIFNRNKKRNRMIRNIRMGRSTFNRMYGGQTILNEGGKKQRGGSSQFVGAPWNPSGNPNTGNYFAPSPNGGGTGLVPILDDGQPLPPGNARFPTNSAPNLICEVEINLTKAEAEKKEEVEL